MIVMALAGAVKGERRRSWLKEVGRDLLAFRATFDGLLFFCYNASIGFCFQAQRGGTGLVFLSPPLSGLPRGSVR
jgi:hypothetical protein